MWWQFSVRVERSTSSFSSTNTEHHHFNISKSHQYQYQPHKSSTHLTHLPPLFSLESRCSTPFPSQSRSQSHTCKHEAHPFRLVGFHWPRSPLASPHPSLHYANHRLIPETAWEQVYTESEAEGCYCGRFWEIYSWGAWRIEGCGELYLVCLPSICWNSDFMRGLEGMRKADHNV